MHKIIFCFAISMSTAAFPASNTASAKPNDYQELSEASRTLLRDYDAHVAESTEEMQNFMKTGNRDQYLKQLNKSFAATRAFHLAYLKRFDAVEKQLAALQAAQTNSASANATTTQKAAAHLLQAAKDAKKDS